MNLSEKIKENFASFLAAFTTQPAEHSAQSTEHSQEQNTTLNTLFDAVSASYPESFTETEGFTPLQKAESLTAFFSSVNDQLATASTQLTESTTALETLTAEHQAVIEELATERSRSAELTEQLSARPSIPLNVTDPALSLSTNQEKDDTGKQILEALPKDLKRQLTKQS